MAAHCDLYKECAKNNLLNKIHQPIIKKEGKFNRIAQMQTSKKKQKRHANHDAIPIGYIPSHTSGSVQQRFHCSPDGRNETLAVSSSLFSKFCFPC